jgi:hypothetical protein
MLNAPMSSAAAATPVAAARYLGDVLIAMTGLLLCGVLLSLGRGARPPGSALWQKHSRAERTGALSPGS